MTRLEYLTVIVSIALKCMVDRAKAIWLTLVSRYNLRGTLSKIQVIYLS